MKSFGTASGAPRVLTVGFLFLAMLAVLPSESQALHWAWCALAYEWKVPESQGFGMKMLASLRS